MEEESARSRQDVLQKLIEYRERDGKRVSSERMNGEVYTLL